MRIEVEKCANPSKPTNEKNLLTAEECSLIRKFVGIFNIANPVEWIRLNCSVARIYFTESSCEHMQKLFASCFQ
uniref:aECM cysteine-cradle domain-containing protein n=1 Tax=Onchocerca volvulus TaxID=6282 RepID=A0A8R1XTI3_ONCVO